MRLMSASIAATAVITAVRAAIRPRMAADRPAIPSLALSALSMKATVSARGSRRHNRFPNNHVGAARRPLPLRFLQEPHSTIYWFQRSDIRRPLRHDLTVVA
jgi:hypothetical protein